MKEISLRDLAANKEVAITPEEGTALVLEDGKEIAAKPLTAEERARIDQIKNEIDLMDSGATIQYGVGAQRNISEFSDRILTQVRANDSGEVGAMMTDLMVKVKDMEIENLDSNNFLDKIPFLKSIGRSLEKFTAKYQTLETQIDRIETDLDGQRVEILKDITMFDQLYQRNLQYFQDVNLYIIAGEERIRELRETTLPRLYEEAKGTGDPMDAQLVRDFEDNVNRFEKKVHDLRLSKTVSMQTAPQIKLIQNNDKLLVEKIQTVMLHTIPLWKSQIVIALGLYRQQNALKTQKEVAKTTNDLLLKNSEMIKSNTIEVARESEKGIVEVETLKKVNQDLISTIEETLKIQKEGKEKRMLAEKELISIENELKQKLLQER